MSRKRRLPDIEDGALWRSITADITPIARRNPPPKRSDPKPRTQNPSAPLPRAEPVVQSKPPMPRPKPQPLAAGNAPDIDRRTAERLRRGQMPIDMRLDLHGMTREEAHRRLAAAIDAAWRGGRRVVLIITGKGQGILQQSVPRWLKEGDNRRRILTFSHAQPKHGGSGALYVLLKRQR
jgi:DNA-nicking Smr family endonuclease